MPGHTTMIRPARKQLLLCAPALFALADWSPAQVPGAPSLSAPSPVPVLRGFEQQFGMQRVVGVAIGADAAALANSVGAKLVGSFGAGQLPIGPTGPGRVALLEWPSAESAKRGELLLAPTTGALFVEPNIPVRTPGFKVCPPVFSASAQQCTAAFFDGAPSLPKYAGQPALPAIALSSSPNPPANSGTVVAVIDTGIDPLHPLFAERLFGPGFDYVLNQPGGFDLPDFQDSDGDGLVDEAHGHGTHVAGAIVLLDPSVRILSLRVLDADGNGSSYAVAEAIYLAAELNVDVINLSLSLAGPSAAVEAALDSVEDEDTAVFASAGNGGTFGVYFPAAYPSVVAVAAVDDAGLKPGFASYGPEVDLVAPGVDIYSAMPGGAWAWWSGSSMATAIASGAAARLISAFNEDAEQGAEALLDGAKSVDSSNQPWAGFLGRGLVDLGVSSILLLQND